MKTAYSYLRFSSSAQKEGDSRRRQAEPAVAWCARNPGYGLDDSLRDEATPAFRGQNATGRRSALARFLLHIEAGIVTRGSVLLLENLDRLSRQNIDDSLELTKKILVAGVDIVTFMPERRYTAASLSNLQERLELEFTFHRAHEESRLKSERLKERWAQRRKAMQEKKAVVSRRLPFWISVVDDAFVLNAKVDWVRHTYKMATQGYGIVAITKHFNANGWKVRRALVDRHLIRNLLKNRQVLGEHQSREFKGSTALGERPASGEPIPGYFPAAITEATFHAAQQELNTRRVAGRGRSNGTVNNLFAGLLIDMRDGGKVYQTQKKAVRYIASWGAMQGTPGSVYISFPYQRFEDAILGCCRGIVPALLTPPSDVDEDIEQCEAALKENHLRIERGRARLARAKDAETEEVVTEQLAELKRERKELEKTLDEFKAKRTAAPQEQMAKAHTFIDLLAKATGEERERLRTMIRALVASLVSKIGVYIQAKSHKQRRCWVFMRFKSGLVRKMLILKDGVVSVDDEDDTTLNIPQGGGWN